MEENNKSERRKKIIQKVDKLVKIMFSEEITTFLLSPDDDADDNFACAVTKKSKDSKGGNGVKKKELEDTYEEVSPGVTRCLSA